MVFYVQDNDEALPPSNWIPKLDPYFKKRGYLTCPLDARGTVSYSINHAVAGRSSTKSSKPAKTVVLYEGRDDKLMFRHNGKAMVVFLDGHNEMIDANGQKELVWTLDGKPAKITKRPGLRPKR
jgi:prepilin-type processing-associated H-X9-DG protein